MLNVKLEVKLWFKTLYWLENLSSSAFSLNTTTSKAFFAQKVLLILPRRVKFTDQNKISKTVYWPRLCPQISKLVNVKWKKRKSITQVWYMVLARYFISLSIKIFLVLMEVYNTAGKLSKYGVFSGSYFPGFGLNTRIFSVNRGTQSEYREIRIRKNSIWTLLKQCSVFKTNRKHYTWKIRYCILLLSCTYTDTDNYIPYSKPFTAILTFDFAKFFRLPIVL